MTTTINNYENICKYILILFIIIFTLITLFIGLELHHKAYGYNNNNNSLSQVLDDDGDRFDNSRIIRLD